MMAAEGSVEHRDYGDDATCTMWLYLEGRRVWVRAELVLQVSFSNAFAAHSSTKNVCR